MHRQSKQDTKEAPHKRGEISSISSLKVTFTGEGGGLFHYVERETSSSPVFFALNDPCNSYFVALDQMYIHVRYISFSLNADP